MNESEQQQNKPIAFARFVQLLGDGDCHAELTAKLHELGGSLQQRADEAQSKVKGSLSLKITLAADESGVVEIHYDIVTKEPKERRPRSVMWIDRGGAFCLSNPRQQQLPYPREVAGGGDVVVEVEVDDSIQEAT